MNPIDVRLRRELLDIPFELDITMDDILDDLFYPHPWRADAHGVAREGSAGA